MAVCRVKLKQKMARVGANNDWKSEIVRFNLLIISCGRGIKPFIVTRRFIKHKDRIKIRTVCLILADIHICATKHYLSLGKGRRSMSNFNYDLHFILYIHSLQSKCKNI